MGGSQMTKLIGQTTYFDHFANQEEQFNVIETVEKVTINGVTFLAHHRNWLPVVIDLNEVDEYLEPLDNPDYNTQIDFQLFREICGFLTAAEVKANRIELGLSLRQTAALLSMGYGTLSAIENNQILQSYDQELKLRLMENYETVQAVFHQHRRLIEQKLKHQHGEFERLAQKLS
ncbi:hypothetical protein FD04_GL000403 [Secundilactobacillus odoratitofui DSM 19909 = JCM 15043]|uniref:Uncharacterized protein n=2 Tax=Secundilactobacillus odoratitofui TaxID=480930 RepID=A0A0R1LSK2_9LACO|nr:hypothetical protein FD04_GL000403 [Secundilactobacillus odoratitofui DSM 19909 = JCM 15043]